MTGKCSQPVAIEISRDRDETTASALVILAKQLQITTRGRRGIEEPLASGGLGIPERMGSNPGYGLSEDWASTRGNGSQVVGFQIRGVPLGGLL